MENECNEKRANDVLYDDDDDGFLLLTRFGRFFLCYSPVIRDLNCHFFE